MKTLVIIHDINGGVGMRVQAASPQDGINYAQSAITCGYPAYVTVKSDFCIILERVDSQSVSEVEVASWETLEEAFPELPIHTLRAGGVVLTAEGGEEVSYVAYERR